MNSVSSFQSPSLPMVPNTPPPPPMFGGGTSQTSPGSKPKRQSFFPTFLGTGDMPSASGVGQKTLLGA